VIFQLDVVHNLSTKLCKQSWMKNHFFLSSRSLQSHPNTKLASLIILASLLRGIESPERDRWAHEICPSNLISTTQLSDASGNKRGERQREGEQERGGCPGSARVGRGGR
jgi:hypothetical protein